MVLNAPNFRREKKVDFLLEPESRLIERLPIDATKRPPKSRLKMAKKVYERYDGAQITDDMLQEAAELFSKNYGVWGKQAVEFVGKFAKAGYRVKLSKDRLREQCLPTDVECSYVRATVDDYLAGHVFAVRWNYGNRRVCWITQLVVDREYRERGLASGLLNEIRGDSDDIYGLMSSHAAACLAATKALGDTINAIELGFIKDHGAAKPRGSLFTPADADADANAMVSCVDTGFFVDHTEPLEALAWAKDNTNWPLGELLDGHEFLLVFEVRRRTRSRSSSKSK